MQVDKQLPGPKVSDDVQMVYPLQNLEYLTRNYLAVGGFTSQRVNRHGMLSIEILAPEGALIHMMYEASRTTDINNVDIVSTTDTKPLFSVEAGSPNILPWFIEEGPAALSIPTEGYFNAPGGVIPPGLAVPFGNAGGSFTFLSGVAPLFVRFGRFFNVINNAPQLETNPLVYMSELSRR